jgi:hypothetical protein
MRFTRLQSVASALTPTWSFWRSVVIASTIVAACLCASAANVNGRIRGTVTDPQNAAIAGAHVTATNTETGVKYETVSGADGGYLFPQLPIGKYSVSATQTGFERFSASGIVLNIDQEYVQPIQLPVGSVSTVVEITSSSVQVDTSDMQFSNIVDSTQMVELPLIGRNFTGLELTLPGVQAASGAERIGGNSVNGAQQQQSEYLINGADTNDITLNTQVITPILDAIGEFNLISGPLNAEYDRNSGGIVSASIKSGTKTYHGDAFEFYRDTFLNTNNFFQKHTSGPQPAVSPFHQNIVGGTVGGPVAPFLSILKNKLFVFGGFQASPSRAPQGTGGSAVVYTTANLAGDFSGDVSAGTPGHPNPNTFSTNPIPSTISIPGCATPGETWVTCLGATGKNGAVPTSAFNSVTKALATKYVPPANNGTTGYTFNETTTTTAYQEDGRMDFNPSPKDQLTFVGIYVFSNVANTLPFSGATLPGFGDGSVSHIQQYTFDYVRQLSTTAVNDFGIHWTRFNFKSGTPQRDELPSSSGFNITPQDPTNATLPRLVVGTSCSFFCLGGTSNGPQPRIDQVYQIEDNFSKTIGGHALKFGFDGRKFSVWNIFDAQNSGQYTFNNSPNPYSTGDASLDFLLGIPGSYGQGTGSIIQADAFLTYFYGQDTWKVSKDLTFNYGVGYSLDTPLRNHQHKGEAVPCFVLNETSKIFPNSPQDLVFPGDPGCTNSGQATLHHTEVGPRVGFSWAPDLGKISGGTGKFSIRGGFGIYYDRTEEESALQTLSSPPFGFTTNGAGDFGGVPQLVNPFADINGGLTTGTGGTPGTASETNRFPFTQPVVGSPVSFASYLPIQAISGFGPSFRAPYAENYQLSVERELPSKIVARVSYVGSQGRQNQIAYEANYETAAGHAECVSDPTCIADRNTQAINYPGNKLANSPNIASLGMIGSGANSHYNGLLVSVTKGESHGLIFQLSYTWAHSIDSGSSLENTGFGNSGERGYNQYQKSFNKGDSTSDARQRLVFSPVYTVPFKHGSSAFSPYNLAVSGWQISGIVTLATGFPYDISFNGGTSRSLWCDAVTDYYVCPDSPNQTGALVLGNPRIRDSSSGHSQWFTNTYGATATFTPEVTGFFGNVRRNPYHGPGLNETDAVIAKDLPLGTNHSRYLQVRMESDNVFNHTQFNNPDGNVTDPTFNQITTAAQSRRTQLAAKIVF